MELDKYFKASVNNTEELLQRKGLKLPRKCRAPLHAGYKPEDDETAELKADGIQWYQEIIGQIHFSIELVRVDIILEVDLLSQHLALTHEVNPE